MLEKQTIRVGMPACFCGLQCSVRRIQADHSLCLELDEGQEDAVLPPLFTQDICWIQTEDGLLQCVGETIERYHSENACRIRMEIKSGLYAVNDHMMLVRSCRLNGTLRTEKLRKLSVIVTEISGEEAWMQLDGQQEDAPLVWEDGTCEAQLVLENMTLSGILSAAGEENRSGVSVYVLHFQKMEMPVWQKWMETVFFHQKQEKNL